ncbi:MAG TPA: methyltransferase domain-containing protein [Candidatus Acidoferrales bacterium]|nr:methyltransferase domain-containing protein [Candidatus Acidoferrales bacterium]
MKSKTEDKHEHRHDRGHPTRFHDPTHAAEYDRRSSMGAIRADLTTKLVDAMSLKGDELVLDLATGTGRAARPLSEKLQSGRIIGVDQAKAMLDVGRRHEDPIRKYSQAAGQADSLPFKANVFDCAFVFFSLHHFADPDRVVREVLRVLKNGGRFFVLDPIVHEARDAVDSALEHKINQVFRRTHGAAFRFHTARSIQRLLGKAGYRIIRSNVLTYPFDQEGMDGIPTGPHWLEAAEELETEAPELAERMRQNYFTWHKHGETVHVKGSFSYALVCGERPV